MIILSWPFSDPGSSEPLTLHAEEFRENGASYKVILVDIRRGPVRLTGAGTDSGHRCSFQLGFWEVAEPSPVPGFAGTKRMNVPVERVVANLLEDLRSHGRGYEIPREELASVLSRKRMKDLATVIEVMSS